MERESVSININTLDEIKKNIDYYELLIIDNIRQHRRLYQLLVEQKELLKSECEKNEHKFIDEVYYDGHRNQHYHKCSICNYVK